MIRSQHLLIYCKQWGHSYVASLNFDWSKGMSHWPAHLSFLRLHWRRWCKFIYDFFKFNINFYGYWRQLISKILLAHFFVACDLCFLHMTETSNILMWTNNNNTSNLKFSSVLLITLWLLHRIKFVKHPIWALIQRRRESLLCCPAAR